MECLRQTSHSNKNDKKQRTQKFSEYFQNNMALQWTTINSVEGKSCFKNAKTIFHFVDDDWKLTAHWFIGVNWCFNILQDLKKLNFSSSYSITFFRGPFESYGEIFDYLFEGRKKMKKSLFCSWSFLVMWPMYRSRKAPKAQVYNNWDFSWYRSCVMKYHEQNSLELTLSDRELETDYESTCWGFMMRKMLGGRLFLCAQHRCFSHERLCESEMFNGSAINVHYLLLLIH